MTFYKILAGIASVLAIVGCLAVWRLPLQGMAGMVVAGASLLALVAAAGLIAALGLDDGPRSDKSVRR